MLRSPLVVVSEYRLSAAGVVLAMAAALWLVAAIAMIVLQVQSGAQQWWEGFVPVVYVDGAGDGEHVMALQEEIGQWEGVATVAIDTPEAMLARLEAHLGKEEIAAVGVEASMMPTGLVVRPQVWRPGEAQVVARVEALEVRPEVLAVDAPQPGALNWMSELRVVGYAMGGIVFLGLVGSLLGLAGFLRRCQQREQQMHHLLEVFGASPSALTRPTLWRGLVLGTVAGGLAGVAFLPWSLAVNELAMELVGGSMMDAVQLSGAVLGLAICGALLGLVVAFICRRPAGGKGESVSEELLWWRREER